MRLQIDKQAGPRSRSVYGSGPKTAPFLGPNQQVVGLKIPLLVQIRRRSDAQASSVAQRCLSPACGVEPLHGFSAKWPHFEDRDQWRKI